LSVEALEEKEAIHTTSPALGAWSEREKMVVDLSEIYKGTFELSPLESLVLTGTPTAMISTGSPSTTAEGQMDVENVYQTLERMPRLWQGVEYPLETILTTYVIYIVSFRCDTKTSLVAILLSRLVLNPATQRGPTS
jgi:hypothetical protein